MRLDADREASACLTIVVSRMSGYRRSCRQCVPEIFGPGLVSAYRDHCVLASPAAAPLLQPDLGESNLQRRFVLTDALELIQPLGSFCRFGRLFLVSP